MITARADEAKALEPTSMIPIHFDERKSFIQNETGIVSGFLTHKDILDFIARRLTPRENENPIWHSPLPPYRQYIPARFTCKSLLLSVTPTEKVYQALHAHRNQVLFMHRPYRLDRKRVPRGTLVVYSHFRFDEQLTTGCNLALASKLHDSEATYICLAGYKNDPLRRIGLVQPLSSITVNDLVNLLDTEFGGTEEVAINGDGERPALLMASLNAFNEDILARVSQAAAEMLAQPSDRNVVLLTGQARDEGLADAKKRGMAVICVGHFRSELWGIKQLARELAAAFPDLNPSVFEEPEELPPPKQLTAQD